MQATIKMLVDSGFARIRMGLKGLEIFSIPGGDVVLHDSEGRPILRFGVVPSRTRVLSMEGMMKGTYTLRLSSDVGDICTEFDA